MNEDRPIVFTISHTGSRTYSILTKDPRGEKCSVGRTEVLFYRMTKIAETLNNEGYAVLFEVD